jgi:CRP/FNR family cyclic AMP-dependent transcriptional regulator
VSSPRKTTKKPKSGFSFDPQAFLATVGIARTIAQYKKDDEIFTPGEPADAIYYIQEGRVKLSITSRQGKEAVIAILGPDDFFGEGSLAGQPIRMEMATAIAPSFILRIEKNEMLHVLHEEHALSGLFIAHLLLRNIRIQEDLVDQLFNSSEKRLARALLLLAHYGRTGHPENIIPKVSHKVLAEMIGTTRPRVSFFMNKFKKLGFIKYNGGLQIHKSLLNIVLHD